MKWLFPIFAFMVTSVEASNLTVRAGEHEGFTRVVIASDTLPDWTYNKSDSQIQVVFSGYIEELDIDRAYERLNAGRVSGFKANDRSLEININCQCGAVTFLSGRNLLVVDIFNDASEYRRKMKSIPERTTDGLASSSSVYSNLPPTSLKNGAQLRQLQESLSRDQGLVMDEAFGLSVELDQQVHNMDLERSLARQFGAALSQGLLERQQTLKPQVDIPHSTASGIQNVEASAFMDVDGLGNDRNQNPVENLTLRSSIDYDRIQDEEINSNATLRGCENEYMFDVDQWVKDEDFHTIISRLRLELYQEFDQLNTEVALSLARAYVYFGFGAEALALVSLIDQDSVEVRVIYRIAEIVEFLSDSYDRNPALNLSCRNDIAFWAALSVKNIPQSADFDINSAIRGFKKLPAHLREILGAEFIERLRKHGDLESAELVMRSYDLLGIEKNSSRDLEAAELNLAVGIETGIEADLISITEGNSDEAPLALIKFIDLQVSKGLPISQDTARLAEAFAMEHRDSEIGPSVRRAHIIALAKSGHFDDAFELERGGTYRLDSPISVREDLYKILTLDASDPVFLKYSLSMNSKNVNEISRDTRVGISERLIGLGFYREARKILNSVSEEGRSDREKILTAQLLMREGEFEKAKIALEGSKEKHAMELFAETLFELGEFAAAAEVFLEVENEEMFFQSMWRGDLPVDTDIHSLEKVQNYRKLKAKEGISRDSIGLRSAGQLLEETVKMRDALLSVLEDTTS